MKKLVSFILCMAFCISSLNIAFAAEDSGVTEALKKVKERIDTTEYDDFRSSYHKNEDGKVSYQFNWSETGEDYKGLCVNLEDGIITSYYKYDYDREGDAGAFSMSAAEAVEIAEAFVKKINPEICETIQAIPEKNYSIQSDSYGVNIYRTQNGIPVLGEAGYIFVSKTTREVTNFYMNYTKGISFKTTDGIISEDEAKKAYKELLPPVLQYRYRRDYQKAEISAFLEYAPKDNGLAINAYDGTVYKRTNGGDRFYANSMSEKSEDAGGYGGFTPAELEEAERIAGLLSEDEAKSIIQNNDIIAMQKGFRQTYSSLNRDFYNKNEYQYEFGFENGEDDYINAGIDAKNGEILSFYKYDNEYVEPKYDRKAEEQKANAAFSALAGEKSAEFHLEENDSDGYISYVRTFDGIDVIEDGAYFGFDSKDNISSYSLNYTKDVEFPSKDGVITPAEAAEKAIDAIGFELVYSVDYENKTAQPVYTIGKIGEMAGYTMNPFTGHLTNYNGDDLEEAEKITYSDIENHYGKAIFSALAEYGIGFDGGELKPDEPITQAEYFTLLNKAFGYDFDIDIDALYRSIISTGIISKEERADDSVLTRENAAIFMIRKIGAEEYARFDEIFVPPFDDVTENKGYIAILKIKGIINGDGSGNFYPQRTVTRGEALIMIYNYFSKN